MEAIRPTVSINRACELAEVTRRTMYNWLRGGKVEYVRNPGGRIRIYPESLFQSPKANDLSPRVR